MIRERGNCIRAVVIRALAERPWTGLHRVAVSMRPARPVEAAPPDDALALRLDFWPEDGAAAIDLDALDAYVLSPVLDECLDFGRRVREVGIVGWGADQEGIPLGEDAIYFVRRGSVWDVA